MIYLVDLGRVVRTLLLDDDYIVAYNSFPFSANVLEQLYAVKGVDIDCIVFILDSSLSTQLSDVNYVAYSKKMLDDTYYASFSKSEIKKLLMLASMLEAKDVRVFDKFGYIHSLAKENSIVVWSQFSDVLFYVHGQQEEFIEHTNATSAADQLLSIMKATGITNIINAAEEADIKAIKYFKNLERMPEEARETLTPALSMFYCALTKKGYDMNIKRSENSASKNASIPVINDQESKESNKSSARLDVGSLVETEQEEQALSEADVLGSLADMLTHDSIAEEEVDADVPDDLMVQDDVQEGALEEEDPESENENEDAIDFDDDESEAFEIVETKIQEKEDNSTVKKHGKLGGKMLNVACVSLLVCAVAAPLLGYATSGVYRKKLVTVDKEIAQVNVRSQKIQDYVSSDDAFQFIGGEELTNLVALSNAPIDGFVGRASVSEDSYNLLIYLYKKDDLKQFESEVKKILPDCELETKESGKLDVANGILYKYKLFIGR